MGAWGPGVFENDDASDWVWELEDDTDGTVLADALSIVTTAPVSEFIEAPDASNALAAAEIVASARGSRAADLPTEAVVWLDAHSAVVDEKLVAKARTAVERIAADSELKELWDESDSTAWSTVVAALAARLA
jgi:hypothetical protein